MTNEFKENVLILHDDVLYYIEEGEDFCLSSEGYGFETEEDWVLACDLISERLMTGDGHKELEGIFDYWWEEGVGYIEIIHQT